MNKKTKKYVTSVSIICLAFFLISMGFDASAFGGGGGGLSPSTMLNPDPISNSLMSEDGEGGGSQCEVAGNKGSTANLNGMAECMENRYGYDKDALRRAKKKKSVPEVEIQFSNTDPVEGEEITAMAIPTHFNNTMENLYFTWTLVHFEGDTQINTTDAGIHEAMGLIARGKFDPCLFGVDEGCDGSYDVADTDNDGYFAPVGGADGVGAKLGDSVGLYDDDLDVMFDAPKGLVRTNAITRCYDHNFGSLIFSEDEANTGGDSGRDLIAECFHKFYNCPGAETGDGDFGLGEEECWLTNPQNPDTDGDGVRDEADVAGLGQLEFTWTYREGDRVSVWVEGTSMEGINEGGVDIVSLCEWGYILSDGTMGTATTYDEAVAACRGELAEEAFEVGTVVPETTTTTETESTTTDNGDGTSSTSGTTTSTIPEHEETTNYNDAAQTDANYEECIDSIQQTCELGEIEFENDADQDEYEAEAGDTNAYYKIMWASPGFDEEGFNYMELVPVDEKGMDILDPELEAYPENPQYEQANPSESDLITVTASINNEGVDDAFLYYDWEVRLCALNDPFECPEEVTDLMEYESFTDGLGIKKLIFRPRDGSIFEHGYSSNRAWLKVSVVVSQHSEYVGDSVLDPDQNYFPIGAVDHVMIPVTRNDMDIRIYRAVNSGGTWTLGDEICTGGTYQDICPLYPNEILAAEVIAPTGSNLFAWQLDSQKIDPPIDCVFSAGCEEYGPIVFFTVDGSAKETGTISVTAKRNATDDLISERMYSIYNPFAVMSSSNEVTQPVVRYDGTPAGDIFEAPMGSRVSFTIDELMPNYVGFDEVNIEWYLNAEQVFDGVILRPEFVERHADLNIAVSADRRTIEFDLDGTYGMGYEVKARIERPVPEEEQEALYDAWRILDWYNLTQDRAVTVKVAYDGGGAASTGSLQQFFASSFANAPAYLVLVIRLAIAMVLVWSIFFGMTYAVKMNYR